MRLRKANFKVNHDRFEEWIEWYGDFIYRLIVARKVVKTREEKRELVEALVLRCAVQWWILVEDDIITSINRDSSAYASALNLKLKKNPTLDECKAMIIGYKYIDFKSVNDIQRFGKHYLVLKCNPFAAIKRDCSEKIDEFMIMRNYIAHYSDYAIRSYHRFIKNRYKLKRIPEPGDFLMATDPKDGRFRWVVYLDAFMECSGDMKSSVI